MSDWLSYYGSLKTARKNMTLQQFARKTLIEENYLRYLRSYEFTFRYQFIGVPAGFLVPSLIIIIIAGDLSYVILEIPFAIVWMFIWLISSMFIPQGKIYRDFGKWYEDPHATIAELNTIFYYEGFCIDEGENISVFYATDTERGL